MDELMDRDRQPFDFEARHWKYAGVKRAQIREVFTESATRYYKRLAALVDGQHPEAYRPQLVPRLRRQREQRLAARSSARSVGWAS
jgi:hypothetical protein